MIFEQSLQIGKTLLVLLVLCLTGSAQNRTEICQVNAYWADPAQKIGSGFMILGYFSAPVPNGDEQTDEIIKTFDVYDTGLRVTAGIKFEWDKFGQKGLPTRVLQGITIKSDISPDVFSDESASLVQSAYTRKWRGQMAIKKLWFEKKLYTFGLRCGRLKTIAELPK
jgi:hypothetical protein